MSTFNPVFGRDTKKTNSTIGYVQHMDQWTMRITMTQGCTYKPKYLTFLKNIFLGEVIKINMYVYIFCFGGRGANSNLCKQTRVEDLDIISTVQIFFFIKICQTENRTLYHFWVPRYRYEVTNFLYIKIVIFYVLTVFSFAINQAASQPLPSHTVNTLSDIWWCNFEAKGST